MSNTTPQPDPYAGPTSGANQPYGNQSYQSYGMPGQAAGPQAPYAPYGAVPYGYGPPPQPQGTNGFAIAGLVLGILPVLAGILGIVFGAIGLRQTKRTGQNGRGMALAGVILGSLWLVLFAVVIVVAVASGGGSSDSSSRSSSTLFPSTYPTPSSSSSSSGAVEGDSESAFQVQVGECLRTIPSGAVHQVDVVPCSQPHAVEAYASFDLTSSSYPGDSQTTTLSQSGCKARFPAFVGGSYDSSSLDIYFLHPTRQSWTYRSDREVLCLVGGNSPSTGTLRNSHR